MAVKMTSPCDTGPVIPTQSLPERVVLRLVSVRDRILAVHMSVCLLAQIWPGYMWFGGRIEPYIVGLPFSLAWTVGWIVVTFGGLLAYHLSAPRSGPRD